MNFKIHLQSSSKVVADREIMLSLGIEMIEIFACTELCAHKSIKNPLSSTLMLFKVVSYFYV